MKSLVHSQISTVAPLKFVSRSEISPQILLGMWLFIHAEMLVKRMPGDR